MLILFWRFTQLYSCKNGSGTITAYNTQNIKIKLKKTNKLKSLEQSN